MTVPSDPSIARLQERDPDAVSALVREHTADILRWVRPWADAPDDADDLVQEVWTKVIRSLGGYRGRGSLRGWLHRVTRSVCADRARRGRGRSERLGRLEAEAASGSGAVPPPGLPATSPAEQALAELPPRQREVVTLRVLDGLSTRETAEAMGCAEGTVKASLHHALDNLRRHLTPDPPSEPTEKR